MKNNNGFIKSLVFQEMPSEVCDVKGKSLILYSVHDVSANRVMEAKCCVVTEYFFLKHSAHYTLCCWSGPQSLAFAAGKTNESSASRQFDQEATQG